MSVNRFSSLMPVSSFHFRRHYVIPIVVVVAIAALAVVVYTVRALINRVWPPLPPQELYDQGMVAFQSGSYSKAIHLLKSAWQGTRNDPQFEAQILVPLAESYFKMADLREVDNKKKTELLTEALKHFDFALDCNPEEQDLLLRIYVGRALIYTQQNLHQKAIGEYNHLLECRSLDVVFAAAHLFKRGLCWCALDEWKQAIYDFTHALECKFLYPNLQAEILFMRGKSYKFSGLLGRALEDLKSALSLNPDLVTLRRDLYIEKGKIHAQKGEDYDAIRSYSDALACEPMDDLLRAEILCERGFAGHHVGLKNASDDFARAQFLNPALQSVIQQRLGRVIH